MCANITMVNFRTFSLPQKEIPSPLVVTLLTPSPTQPPIYSLSLDFPIPDFYMNGIMYVDFWVWLLSVRIMFSRFIQVVACVSTSFLFMAEEYPILWIYHILFIHSSVDEHLSCFYLSAIRNNTTNIRIQVFV